MKKKTMGKRTPGQDTAATGVQPAAAPPRGRT